MLLAPDSKLLLIGDSITDCGRARPVGEGPVEALGSGYVSLVGAWLAAGLPQAGIRVVNMGIGGDTVRDLKTRWKSDVLDLHPDWLSIKIGINDVWRHFDGIPLPAGLISQDEYETTLDELIRQTLPGLKGLILMTPYFIEPDRNRPMRAMMDRYGASVRKLAGKHAAVLVDTQAAFDQVLEHIPPTSLSADRVHPGLVGHMTLARAFLQAIEFPWQ